MFRDYIRYQSHSRIVVDNTPENRLTEEQFYDGLSLSENEKMVIGEWYLGKNRVWMTQPNGDHAVFMMQARLATMGICVGEQNPYILQADTIQ